MCKLCETKPVYEFTNKRKVCKACYIQWFEKKFFYTIRRFNLISKRDILAYEDIPVLEHLMKILETRAPIKITKLPTNKFNKKVIYSSIDCEAKEIFYTTVSKDLSKLKIAPKIKKQIFPLYLFTEYEIQLYAKLKNIKHKSSTQKDKFLKLLDKFEKKHPEVKRAVVNGFLELN